MDDLYEDLLKNAEKNDVRIQLVPSTRQSMVEMMPEFTSRIKNIRLKIQLLKNINEDILQMTEAIHSAASTQKEKECMKKVDQLQLSTTKQIAEIKKLFDETDRVIKSSDPEDPETRAMVYNKKAIQQEVADLLQASQNVVHQYNQTVQQKMRRQVRVPPRKLEILQPNLSDKQMDEVMKDPNGLEKVVMEQVLGQPSLQLVQRVQDIQEKYRDIQKLERSTQQCFQMLQEIAFLVNQQGEELETIEANLKKAQNYVEKGTKVLAEEKKIHQKSRKKMCCILLLGLVALGVIATPIILKFVNANKNN